MRFQPGWRGSSDKLDMENEVEEKGWWAGGSASALCDSAARLLPALQVEVREPLGCRHERSKACGCWALSRRSWTLLSQIPNLARRTSRSRGRKSLTCRVVCAQVPGRAGAQGAPVIAILPGNENERAGSGFHSRPRGLGGGPGHLLRDWSPRARWLRRETWGPLASSRRRWTASQAVWPWGPG